MTRNRRRPARAAGRRARTRYRPYLLSLLLHAAGLGATFWMLPSAPARPLQVRLASLVESTASHGVERDVMEFATEVVPTELVEVESADPVGDLPVAEPVAADRAVEPSSEPARDELSECAWNLPRSQPVAAADAMLRVRRRHPQVTPSSEPVTSVPPAAAPASVAHARVLTPLLGCNPAPEYPALARQRRIEGVVELLLTVDAQGDVVGWTVLVSSGSRLLDDAAIKAARRWRFEHGPGQAQVPFRFDLQAASARG